MSSGQLACKESTRQACRSVVWTHYLTSRMAIGIMIDPLDGAMSLTGLRAKMIMRDQERGIDHVIYRWRIASAPPPPPPLGQVFGHVVRITLPTSRDECFLSVSITRSATGLSLIRRKRGAPLNPRAYGGKTSNTVGHLSKNGLRDR